MGVEGGGVGVCREMDGRGGGWEGAGRWMEGGGGVRIVNSLCCFFECSLLSLLWFLFCMLCICGLHVSFSCVYTWYFYLSDFVCKVCVVYSFTLGKI